MATRKPRSRKAMTAFLAEHFRYSTMNSWNLSTSYAKCVKVHALGLSREQADACYGLLDAEGCWDASGYSEELRKFDRAHGYRWQIGTNGRSGGYLVLYQGERRPSEYKSRCDACGQHNCLSVAEVLKCGRCGEEGFMEPYEEFQVTTFPGRSTDQGEDFADWSTSALRERVDLVWDFDRACEAAVRAFVDYAVDHRVVERTVFVPKQIKVIEEA